jgi:hypothetical protein
MIDFNAVDADSKLDRERDFRSAMQQLTADIVATPRTLTFVAETLEDLTEAKHIAPSRSLDESFSGSWYGTAQTLRNLAGVIAKGDAETTERLAKAGEVAAQAQSANAMWRTQYNQLRNDFDQLDLENGELTGELERARIDRNSAVEAFFQASVKLQQSQKYIREVRDFLNAAIEDLESGAEDELDLEVGFIFVAAGEGGLSPDLYSDLALALSDLNGETESE